jgi:hypothetical protein
MERADLVAISQGYWETAPTLVVSKSTAQRLERFGHGLEREDPATIAELSQSLGKLPAVRTDIEHAVHVPVFDDCLDMPIQGRRGRVFGELDAERTKESVRER